MISGFNARPFTDKKNKKDKSVNKKNNNRKGEIDYGDISFQSADDKKK